MGCVKSTVCQWLRKAPLAAPELPPGGTLELDGLWTRTRRGRTELKAIRAAAGTALGDFGSWAEVIDRAWQLGAQHQLRVFHLLREYRQNIGTAGFAAARRLLDAGSLAEAEGYATQALGETDGRRRTGAKRRW